MATSELRKTAPRLQMGFSMKFVVVAILAVGLLAGCGVGADEAWDMNANAPVAAKSSQAIEETAKPATAPQTPGTTTPVPTRDPGQISLPQDPIPVFEAKPLPTPTTAMPVGPAFDGTIPIPPNR